MVKRRITKTATININNDIKLFNCYSLIINVEIWQYKSSNLFFFFPLICHGYSCPFAFPCKFQKLPFNFHKILCWDFYQHRIKYIDQFRKTLPFQNSLQSINMVCPSTDLGLLLFLSAMFIVLCVTILHIFCQIFSSWVFDGLMLFIKVFLDIFKFCF